MALGQWHRVTAERVNKDGTLLVDDAAPVKRSSPGKSLGLNLRSPLYLGGTEPPLRPPTNASFRGCIGEVTPPLSPRRGGDPRLVGRRLPDIGIVISLVGREVMPSDVPLLGGWSFLGR